MKLLYFTFFAILSCELPHYHAKSSAKNILMDTIVDVKDFKKMLRTKTNVLVCFMAGKQAAPALKIFKETASLIKGQGTLAVVDCFSEAKKLCKKLKISPNPYVLKHYKDGEFNKDYDRKETVSSMVNFMRDPSGDVPWEEDSTAADVIHISDASSLAKFIRKESKPIMIMFYAPWCGFCKTLKPEYAAAADELQGHSVLAAIDVNRPENAVVRTQYNITGFPTLLYYENGSMKYQFEGENNKNGIVSFMRNPQAPPVKLKEPEWSDTDSEVVHLTTSSFDPVIKEEVSVLVMFYAPWCGHCKKMKPEYENAASVMKTDGVLGMLAAVDATKEPTVASRFSVKGYPTVLYFSYGELLFSVNVRESPKIVAFMKDPREPPPPPPPEIPWSEEQSEVVHLTEETFKPFLKKKKHVLVIFYTPWCGHCKRAKPEFSKAAEKFKDDPKVEFAAVDCTMQQTLCDVYDVKGYPTIKYFSYYSKVVKSYKGSRTEQDFITFMNNPEGSSDNVVVTPVPVKSEWVGSDSGNILHLTDLTFKKEIQSHDLILVMFYAPWCGHCKKMKPDYSKAADELKVEGFGGRLAVFDCTENPEITEEFSIDGFPTIKLFKQGKFIADYKGKRTLEDFKLFMKRSHTKDEL